MSKGGVPPPVEMNQVDNLEAYEIEYGKKDTLKAQKTLKKNQSATLIEIGDQSQSQLVNID